MSIKRNVFKEIEVKPQLKFLVNLPKNFQIDILRQ